MRVTIAHTRPKAEVIQIVDKSVDDVFKGAAGGLLHISDPQKKWTGDTLTFSLHARAGFLSAPVQGTVLVTDKDVTIDADLGIFGKFISEEKARAAVETRVKGLLA